MVERYEGKAHNTRWMAVAGYFLDLTKFGIPSLTQFGKLVDWHLRRPEAVLLYFILTACEHPSRPRLDSVLRGLEANVADYRCLHHPSITH